MLSSNILPISSLSFPVAAIFTLFRTLWMTIGQGFEIFSSPRRFQSLALALTCQTGSFTRWAFCKICPTQWMAKGTMSFTGVDRWRAVTAQNIDLLGNRFSVSRVHATRPSAKMVTDQMVRYALNKQLVKQAMGCIGFLVNRASGISRMAVNMGVKIPTRRAFVEKLGRDFNSAKQSSQQFTVNRKSGIIRAGHGVFSFIENSVIRLGERLQHAFRATLILPQTMQKWDRSTRISVVAEVCYR